jgi:4-amino-4-deoxy-L-arabinose transferase-like glycosyltransferase
MSKKIVWALLLTVIILAAVLRLWQLGSTPVSPDWDEVALGYDSYSLLQTGRDQYGHFLPVVLRSLDDYKPALYAYLTIPSVTVFGLNVFAIRFPSAIFGILSVLAVFYLVRELFENHKYRDNLALLSGFLLAISPWSVQFSRVGFESNVGTAFNIFSALFFLKGLKKPWLLFLSAIFAALSIYTYQSEKVFTPLLVIALVLIYRKKLFSLSRKYIITALVIGIVVILPMIFYLINDKSSLQRLGSTSIFASQTTLLKMDVQKLNREKITGDTLGLILDNRRVVYAKTILSGYLSHFDLNWLFITGDLARHHAFGMGLLYLVEFPFLLLGLYMLAFGNFDKKTKLLVFSWVLLAPIPASITMGVPHAVRTMNFLPTLQILTAIGFLSAFLMFKKYKELGIKYYVSGVMLTSLFFILATVNVVYYLNQYFVQSNYFTSADWQYGYKQAVDEINLIGTDYKEIVVSNKQPLDQSYIFFLFYLKYPPEEYQKTGANISSHSFAKYTFRPLNWQKDSLKKNILFIGSPRDIPDSIKPIKTIYNLDGSAAIKIVGT